MATRTEHFFDVVSEHLAKAVLDKAVSHAHERLKGLKTTASRLAALEERATSLEAKLQRPLVGG